MRTLTNKFVDGLFMYYDNWSKLFATHYFLRKLKTIDGSSP